MKQLLHYQACKPGCNFFTTWFLRLLIRQKEGLINESEIDEDIRGVCYLSPRQVYAHAKALAHL